jgi:hypothetical protein
MTRILAEDPKLKVADGVATETTRPQRSFQGPLSMVQLGATVSAPLPAGGQID